MKKKPKKQWRRKAKTHTGPIIQTTVHPDSAGIDVGAAELVVAVPPGRNPQGSVRTFRTFTSGVEAMRDWLLANRITTVALESTGNYWITAYDTLEAAGMEVYLVNARHVKGVPGKKTDVCDAQWLQQLHAAGLLKKSFRPEQHTLPLRYLMRHRHTLVADAARAVQHMQKVLTELNIKIQHVFSDIDGVSAQAIITAILQGERDPRTLARLRNKSCRSKEADIIEALKGNYREEYLFVLAQVQAHWLGLQKAIAESDQKIITIAQRISPPVADASASPADAEPGKTLKPRPTAKPKKLTNKNSIDPIIYEQARGFYGVDLSEIPGVGPGVLASLMSEIGPRKSLLKAFPSSGAFCSWMGLCPDNRVSGGKVLKAKTRKVPSRLARALRLGVFGINRGENKMAHHTRRLKSRLGKAEGLTAAAHKVARIIYGMIERQTRYDENEAFKTTPETLTRRRKNLEKQAATLGFHLVPLEGVANLVS
jgi:transposase